MSVKKALALEDLPLPPEGKVGWPWTEATEAVPDRMPNGSEWPKISIVTPSYNQGNYIEETIRSILLQGYSNLEYVIIDGASTDRTIEIIKKYEPFLNYWVSEPDLGQANAINKGLNRCSGDIFNWINSDDFLSPDVLKIIASTFTKEYDVLAASCINFYDDTEDFEIVQNANLDIPKKLMQDLNTTYHQPGVWLRTNLVLACGKIDENLHYCFDGDLMMRYLYSNQRIKYIPDCLVNFRFHQGSKTIISRNGEDNFFKDYVTTLKKMSRDNKYVQIHSYCNIRLRQLDWIDIIQVIKNKEKLSSWQKTIEILQLIWQDPQVRISRLTFGSIKSLVN